MSATHYERVGKAIDLYEEATIQAVGSLKIRFLFDISAVTVTIILLFLSYFFSNLAGVLSALGIGSINIANQYPKWRKTITNYRDERDKLARSVSPLRIERERCGNDDACFDRVAILVIEAIKALEKARKRR